MKGPLLCIIAALCPAFAQNGAIPATLNQKTLHCALVALLTFAAAEVSAQTSSNRYVDAIVTEPHDRFVIGAKAEHFEVIENRVSRAIRRVTEQRGHYRIEFEVLYPVGER